MKKIGDAVAIIVVAIIMIICGSIALHALIAGSIFWFFVCAFTYAAYDTILDCLLENIEESSNGRTTDFDPVNTGSNPVSSSNQ